MMRRAATRALAARRGRCTMRWTTACFATNRSLLLQGVNYSRDSVSSSGGGGMEESGTRCERWRGNSSSSNRNNHNKNHNGGPVKDRFPPVATDLSDPRRRLALLVDASSVDQHVFRNTILPAALKVGVPVLVRIFAVQLSSGWESVVAGNDVESKAEEEVKASGIPRCPPVEFFRVERFIPVPMQIEADANHIFDFRRQNKIEAVCFVCNEVDRGVFEGFLSNIAGNGFNQYVLDDLGMAKEVIEDGRSADGATPL